MPKNALRGTQAFALAVLLVTLAGRTPAVRADTPVGCGAPNLITAIQTAVSGDTLVLPPGCDLVLTTSFDGFNGLPPITNTLTIIGNGDTIERSTALGTPNFRLLQINGGASLTLQALTLANGLSQVGGDITNNGTLTMTNVTVKGAQASVEGGGISNGGTLSLILCAISGNQAPIGGGIFSQGPTTITETTIEDNEATDGSGGGVWLADNTVNVDESTFFNNTAPNGAGGGAGNAGSGVTTFTNDTFFGNQAAYGSAYSSASGTTNIASTTITSNTASQAGAILAINTTLHSDIVAGNNAPFSPNVYTTVNSSGFNIFGDIDPAALIPTQPTDHLNVSPAAVTLGTLGGNGGPTSTVAIGQASLANGAGNCSGVPTDQRGVSRETPCDSGAFELLGGGGGGGGGNNPPPQSGQSQATAPVSGLCSDVGALTGAAITVTGGTDDVEANGTKGNVYCRDIKVNGQIITNVAEIGDPNLLNLNPMEVINLWGMLPNGTVVNPFSAPVTVCLQGVGTIVFVPAGDPNHTVQPLTTTTQGDHLCGSVPASGLVVVINNGNGQLYTPAPVALNNCFVTTTKPTPSYSAPTESPLGGGVIQSGASLGADAAVPGWLRVNSMGHEEWVRVSDVTVQGDCGPANQPASNSSTPSSVTPLSDCHVTTTHSPLNLRGEPNTTSAILDKLPYNQRLTATAFVPDWYEVIWKSIQGWVSSRYVNLEGDCGQ